jgi:hypothetical protein
MPRVSKSGSGGDQQQTGKVGGVKQYASDESGRVKGVGAPAGQEPRPAYWLHPQPRKGNAGTNKARWQTDSSLTLEGTRVTKNKKRKGNERSFWTVRVRTTLNALFSFFPFFPCFPFILIL